MIALAYRIQSLDQVINEVKEEENGFLNFLGDVGSGVTKVEKGLLDFLLLDDVNTLADKDASGLDKGIALASFIPIGKVLKTPKAIVSKDQLKSLLDLIKKEELNDKLIDFLVQYIDSDWENNGSEYLFSNPYGYVQNIIEAENQNTALELLKVYLEKEWYKGHNDTGWYESHKGNKDIYSGYWSYESGAVAKILRLDDTLLREVPYYPYDLVHFEE
ncbi:MAG: DUF1911 domain-containing protein [Solibacillus sp.]|uniref:DUF1911 domain-containing protein n=1 Tax=Solibacillus sp. TaxID=1909654 RepID=UPI003314E0EB